MTKNKNFLCLLLFLSLFTLVLCRRDEGEFIVVAFVCAVVAAVVLFFVGGPILLFVGIGLMLFSGKTMQMWGIEQNIHVIFSSLFLQK